MTRKTALSLNAVIVSAYVAVALLAPTPWSMLAGFLVFAIAIRCATLCWAAASNDREISLSRKA